MGLMYGIWLITLCEKYYAGLFQAQVRDRAWRFRVADTVLMRNGQTMTSVTLPTPNAPVP
jgi:hypothetical protein